MERIPPAFSTCKRPTVQRCGRPIVQDRVPTRPLVCNSSKRRKAQGPRLQFRFFCVLGAGGVRLKIDQRSRPQQREVVRGRRSSEEVAVVVRGEREREGEGGASGT